MQRSHVGGTVITGATGFVGGELVVKLLRESTSTLICPIRAASDEAALARGNTRLIELVGPTDAQAYRHRVRWLRADIEERHLGWSAMHWHAIAMQTKEIFHCAASVSFDLPLHRAHRINVAGTIHVFDLAVAAAARHNNFRRFHHVSTAYVAGRVKGRVGPNFLPPDKGSLFRNTYERTKARAERYLRAEASSRVPVSIHRPSIIAGKRDDGETTNWNVLYVPMRMVARGQLPAISRGGRQLVDSIGVDFLVDAMVVFSQLDSLPVEAHHLTAGSTAFTVTDVMRTTSEEAHLRPDFTPSDTRLLGPVRWRLMVAALRLAARLPKQLKRVRSTARLALRGIAQCGPYLSYTMVDTVFDATKDHDVLRVFGVEMPPGREYLDTLIDYALTANFGKRVPVGLEAVAA